MDDVLGIAQGFGEAVRQWGSAGAAAGALAFVYLAIRAMKLPPIWGRLERWFSLTKWARPGLGFVLGALAGALQALAAKKPWSGVAFSAVFGAIGGLGATGFDQLLPTLPVVGKLLKPDLHADSAVAEAIRRGDMEVRARVDGPAREYEEASKVADPKTRRELKAAWARRYLRGGSR